MARMSRKDYAQLYGPTKGDAIRLGDTSLLAEVEHDYAVPGEECLHGGGKTLRDGLGLTPGYDSAMGALDMLLCNALVIDPVLGIVKGDIGIKDGKIVGIGKAGNPATMDGVHPEPDRRRGHHGARRGRHDRHARRHRRPCAFRLGAAVRARDQLRAHHHDRRLARSDHRRHRLRRRLQRRQDAAGGGALADQFRLSRPGQHIAAGLASANRSPAGAIGLKIHEDWGAMPAVIDTCLSVADELDFQVQLHTDTLNESGFLEDTLAAIRGRTIHMYHTEGAGGGHAPDIIRVAGEMNCLPSSTNPTNPYTVNTFDEHLDMTMVCHHLNPAIPEDVAFAESRIRAQTIAAEDVLHDIGAISMLGSDSQGMGRIGEVICRTWQLASKMKDQRGPPAGRENEARRQRTHQALHRQVHHQRGAHVRHRRVHRLARAGQDRRRRAVAAGLLRHQAGDRGQGRLHRLGRHGRQRGEPDDLRAAAHASAVGRVRARQAGA